jgi:hypothetical protein
MMAMSGFNDAIYQRGASRFTAAGWRLVVGAATDSARAILLEVSPYEIDGG